MKDKKENTFEKKNCRCPSLTSCYLFVFVTKRHHLNRTKRLPVATTAEELSYIYSTGRVLNNDSTGIALFIIYHILEEF